MAEEEETREVLFSDWSGPEKQGMTLEQSGEGEIYVKEVKMESPAGRTGRVHEGDQIVGATIYFDNMSSEETAELLKTLNKHKVGLKLQNKDKSPCRSPMGTLSPSRSPMGTLTYEGKGRFGGSSQGSILSGEDEDYKRIYSKKIKPRLKSEDLAEGVDIHTERHSSTSTDGSTITTVTRRITTYSVDMPGGVDEQLELTGPEFKGQRYEQSGGGSSSQIRVLHGSSSGGLEGGDFELGGDGVSFTGPHVTSSSEKHWSTGGVKTTTVTREIEGGDGGAAGIRFKGPSFGMSGVKAQTLDINNPGIKESGSVKTSVKGPSVKGTTIENESKLKGGFKMPSFGLNIAGTESDGDVKLPKVKGSVDVSVPGMYQPHR
ncbi:unnamed protein product [Oncorhynchus mykiss]|uniref:PDZ domain-containing protein n=1 Tax=Oncorhynchus mykiss TaxID=8022 RepID=A0A060ZDW3_ONCMY|nr:unnamed protein product [Oncorhynchus mykiss]